MSHRFKANRSRTLHSWKRQDRTEALLRKTCALIRTQAQLDSAIAQFAPGQPSEQRIQAQRELFLRMKEHLPFSARMPSFLEETYVP